MTRFCLAFCLVFTIVTDTSHAQWSTVKGQVVFPAGKELPAAKPIVVNTDKEHCLAKGPLKSEELIIDPKTRGVKNVWVFLRPALVDTFAANQIHPDLAKAKPVEHVIDQPCCQFIPRILAARDGDTLLVKNSSPVPHNINFQGENLAFNQTIAAGGTYKAEKPLSYQRNPIGFACNVHPWMGGKMMVFDHPYFAVTDEKGNFEIKNAPQGGFRIFYRHELGYHMGRNGAKGFPITIAGPTTEQKPLELVLPDNK
jgi:plastocyanin